MAKSCMPKRKEGKLNTEKITITRRPQQTHAHTVTHTNKDEQSNG